MTNLNEQVQGDGHFISVGDAARYLGVGRKVVYQLIEYSRIRAVRRRQVLMVDMESLKEFTRAGQMT